MTEVIYKEESYRIMGACFEVYKNKGCGFHETVYQECLSLEFEMQHIPAISKPPLKLEYKGRSLLQTYQPDYICFERIIVELKALATLADDHKAQVMNYLKATNLKLGLLINFGHHPRLEFERILAHDAWSTASAEEIDLQV